MAADCPPSRLRALGRMIMTWPGIEKSACPTLVIHGDSDRIIPIRCSQPDLVLASAGHAFTLTHPDQTSSAIRHFLSRL